MYAQVHTYYKVYIGTFEVDRAIRIMAMSLCLCVYVDMYIYLYNKNTNINVYACTYLL